MLRNISTSISSQLIADVDPECCLLQSTKSDKFLAAFPISFWYTRDLSRLILRVKILNHVIIILFLYNYWNRLITTCSKMHLAFSLSISLSRSFQAKPVRPKENKMKESNHL